MEEDISNIFSQLPFVWIEKALCDFSERAIHHIVLYAQVLKQFKKVFVVSSTEQSWVTHAVNIVPDQSEVTG